MRTLRQTRDKPAGKGSHSLLKGPKAAGDKKGKSGKLTSTKNKIRGVERLLRKAGIDNKLRRSLDAKLSELQGSLNKHNQEELERKFAVRYHKIRFFERVKLERRIKQLQGKAKRGHALSAVEQQQIQKWEQELQYVLHFPKGERYVSILKDAAEPEAQVKLDAERARLKAVIKHQQAESAILTEADEGLGLAESSTKAKPDAEGDAFFLDSNDEQSSEKAPVRSPMPAAAVAVPQRKRARADFTASLAQESVSQQAQQAQDATGVLHEQPPARRQALLTLPQHKKAAAKRVRTSSMVDVPGFGNAQQDPEQDRPAALQPSHHAAQPTAHVLPKPGPIVSLGPAENGEQSATKAGLARRQTKDGRSRAVSAANEAAKVQPRMSAASRSQLLLQQLEQKYAKSKQLSRPDVSTASTRASGQQLHIPRQAFKLAASQTHPIHVARPVVPKPSLSKLMVAPDIRQIAAPKATGTVQENVPVRTRAEGGRKRRK